MEADSLHPHAIGLALDANAQLDIRSSIQQPPPLQLDPTIAAQVHMRLQNTHRKSLSVWRLAVAFFGMAAVIGWIIEQKREILYYDVFFLHLFFHPAKCTYLLDEVFKGTNEAQIF